jgi:hypothetical protein
MSFCSESEAPKPPPNRMERLRTWWQEYRAYVYNPKQGKIFSRTPTGWGKYSHVGGFPSLILASSVGLIILYYLGFYATFTLLFAVCFAGLVLTLPGLLEGLAKAEVFLLFLLTPCHHRRIPPSSNADSSK